MIHQVLLSDAKTTEKEAIESALDGVDARVRSTVAHDEEALRTEAAGASALIVDANTPVTGDVLTSLSDLQVVGRAGIGFDNVAVDVATDNGITVVNVPDYCIEEVSTHALALLFACLRRITVYDSTVKDGTWEWTGGRPIPRLAGSTVGLFAFGKIGRRFAAKLRGFDIDVVAYDPHVPDYRMDDLGVEPVGFDRLLSRSDILSVHAPLTDETRGTFDEDAFEAMGDGAILVNTARGPIVDEGALVDALESGSIDAAGLDVRETEPPVNSPLNDRDDVVLSPHVGWYSEQSRVELSQSVASDVARVLRGEEPQNPVDPEPDWG
ncbi:MAG: C-terminal binding protein [Halorientalis sp.]